MNCCDRKWSMCLHAALVGLAIWIGPSSPLFGLQFASPSPFGASATAPVDERAAKVGLALEAASVAAESEMFDLSFEAVKRVCAEGPPIAKPQIQSSLLGGQANTAMSARIISGRQGYQIPDVTVQYSAKLYSIVDKWKSMKAPPERIAEALEQIVFPAGRPNEIMLFSSAPPTNANSYNYEFSFASPKTTRYLAFELIELAAKNKTLSSLIEKLEKMRLLPTAQAQAVAMLVYAKRASGQADAAAKTLEELLAAPVAVDFAMPLYDALTQTVPEAGEPSVVAASVSLPLLNKLLKDNARRMEIRSALLQQLKQAIQSEDQTDFESIVATVVESINQMGISDQNSLNYMLANFYRSLSEECKRQGKAALAVDVSTRAVDLQSDYGQGIVLDPKTMSSFIDLQPDVRLKALRKMLVERPLVKFTQFSFSPGPQPSKVPDFFRLKAPDSNLPQFLPYEGAKAISLLDLLLNQNESEGGDVSALTKALLANAGENEDVKRFVAVWLNLRNEKRGKPIDAELAKLAKFESEKEYFDWWKLLPTPAALELLSLRSRTVPQSPEMQEALESRFTNEQPPQTVIEMRYQQRLSADKTLVNASRLKHWIVSFEPINWQSQAETSIWAINEKKQVDFFGGTWYAQLIFRYPLPVNSTIKVIADRSDKKTDGLYVGGVTMMSYDEQQGYCYAMASNARTLGQFSVQSSAPKRALEGTLKENSMSLKVGDKSIEILDYGAKSTPFVGLANYGVRPAAFSDVAITAPAAIPREVPLLDDGLPGWSAYLFGHALPSLSSRLEIDGSDSQASYSEQSSTSPMWNMVDNELRAGKLSSEDDESKPKEDTDEDEAGHSSDAESKDDTAISQSNLSYARPLCDGEQIEYEFFHQPDVQNASPSLGRIAYLIRDDKIQLRWIATSDELLKPDKETGYLGDDPTAEVLAPVKLKANAWNRVRLRSEGGKVVLSIGETDVYRRTLEKEHIARFGFYFDPQKDQVRVKNVVLKGNWPTELPKDLWELE